MEYKHAIFPWYRFLRSFRGLEFGRQTRFKMSSLVDSYTDAPYIAQQVFHLLVDWRLLVAGASLSDSLPPSHLYILGPITCLV